MDILDKGRLCLSKTASDNSFRGKYAITISPLRPNGTSKSASTKKGYIRRVGARLHDLIGRFKATLIKEYHEDGWAHYHGILVTNCKVDPEHINKMCKTRWGHRRAVGDIEIHTLYQSDAGMTDPTKYTGWISGTRPYCLKDIVANKGADPKGSFIYQMIYE